MFNIIIYSTLFLVAVCSFTPLGYMLLFAKSNSVHVTPCASPSTISKSPNHPEDSTLRRHFMAQIQHEIEASLLPRPTDSVLQRHYDSLVEVTLRNRLENYR